MVSTDVLLKFSVPISEKQVQQKDIEQEFDWKEINSNPSNNATVYVTGSEKQIRDTSPIENNIQAFVDHIALYQNI